MEKHANTYFPGDKVVRVTDHKTASDPGSVLEYDSTTEMFKVAFSGGTDWVSAEDLQKTA